MVGLSVLAAFAPACSHEFDTSRTIPARGTVGEEIYGVMCDRIGAQSLREDLTGASFRAVCHRPAGGEYADKVDLTKLPSIDPAAVDARGTPVSPEVQRQNRTRAVAKVEALARRRADLVRALDATFPDQMIPIKDLDNPDPTRSCQAPAKSGEGKLTTQLADMLGRMGDLYNDGTIPDSTQSLARVVDSFRANTDAQAAWARISARQGYRPIETALGAARPVIAYPNLRDLSNASLRLLSADSNPYELDPKRDADGRRIPVPGPGNAALNKLLEAGKAELLDAKPTAKLEALAITTDPETGRVILSRPRDNLEVLQEVLFTSDEAFGGGPPQFIVRRDPRGYARIAGGAVPSPFLDEDGDGLPDVDAVGRFKTTDGSLAPAPFPFPGGPDGPRDEFGRALGGDRLLYDYLDTSHTFAAQMLSDARALVNPDPAAKQETAMDLLGGLYVAAGPRVASQKAYASSSLSYQGIDVEKSPLLDLVYALGVILSDRNSDATLSLVRTLFTTKQPEIARAVGGMNAAMDIANAHPEAKIPSQAVFWDDALDTLAKVAQEPGLLEDIMRALATPESAKLGTVFSKFANYKDEISYDTNDLNSGPYNVTTNSKTEMKTPVDRNAPETGKNRSALYRFLGLIHDTTGVTACNKPNAKVHARLLGLSVTMPLLGSGYGECEVFKLDNLAAFYLDSIVNAQQYDPGNKPNKRGAFYLRNDTLREGIALGIGAATVNLMQDSSAINGFWTDGGSTVLAPKPVWLNRLVFFDLVNDGPNPTDRNYRTNHFIADLSGPHIGSAVCPERVIKDPLPNAPDASPDGMVHGLRDCPEGSWIQQRGKNTIFTWENFGFYDAIRPLLSAFVKHGREDLFLELGNNVYRHFPGAEASADECRLANGATCPRAGMNSYEPLLVEALLTDAVPALQELTKALDTMPIKRCDAVDPATQKCTKTTTQSGIDVAAQAARAMLDPAYAKTVTSLTDRHGNPGTTRNDGQPVAQVTPAYLLAQAFKAIDDTFDAYEAQHPDDKDRRVQWRRARSQLVDQFLGVQGSKTSSSFRNPTIPKMTPVLLDLVRSQLLANCPRSFAPPYEPCDWAKKELLQKAQDALVNPLTPSGLDMLDAIRKDPEGRRQTELLLTYLLDAASRNDALPSVLASTSDLVQLLRDDDNLLPLYKVLASAMGASEVDANGKVVKKSLIDAQMALLARVSGRAFDKAGTEICKNEVDPNQLLSIALGHLVTPIKDGDFKGQTPLEVLIDVIADVNRADPSQPYEGTLGQKDYGVVSENVVDFLTNKERGLEQFYEVIRQGTKF